MHRENINLFLELKIFCIIKISTSLFFGYQMLFLLFIVNGCKNINTLYLALDIYKLVMCGCQGHTCGDHSFVM